MCWYWGDISYWLCIDVNNADLYLVMEKPTKGVLKCLIWTVSHKSSMKIGFVAQCNVVHFVENTYHLAMVWRWQVKEKKTFIFSYLLV